MSTWSIINWLQTFNQEFSSKKKICFSELRVQFKEQFTVTLKGQLISSKTEEDFINTFSEQAQVSE